MLRELETYWHASPDGEGTALRRLLEAAPAEDAPVLLALLCGFAPDPLLSRPRLRALCADATGLPDWLLRRCREETGDLASACARVWPGGGESSGLSLDVCLNRLLPELRALPTEALPPRLCALWDCCGVEERMVLNRLLLGLTPPAPPRELLARIWAELRGLDADWILHCLAEQPCPDAAALARWRQPPADVFRPPPFPAADLFDPEVLSAFDPACWQVEWKWDGLRVYLQRRAGRTHFWSREEAVTDRFPALVEAAEDLPADCLLEGLLLEGAAAGEGGACFVVWDCLEVHGVDIRDQPLFARWGQLLPMFGSGEGSAFRLSEPLEIRGGEDLRRAQVRSAGPGRAGLLLKPLQAAYGVPGALQVWPAARFEVRAMLLYALLEDPAVYTFGLRGAGADWLPFARVTAPAEFRERLDEWIERQLMRKRGPLREVSPGLCGRISFRAVHPSPRHKCGVTVDDARLESIDPPGSAGGADALADQPWGKM